MLNMGSLVYGKKQASHSLAIIVGAYGEGLGYGEAVGK